MENFLTSSPPPEQVRRVAQVSTGLILAITLILLGRSGLLSWGASSVDSSDLDLSGTWKIRYEDHPGFARADWEDTQWCSIQVPNAGVASPEGKIPPGCPRESYPRERMRNSVYWYRKTVQLSADSQLKDPSLYLGAIKRRAWVYWDGEFIGMGMRETSPTILLLPASKVKAGFHQLAVRVESGDDSNPGIFHAHPRKVALGEYSLSVQGIQGRLQTDYLEPVLAFAVQWLSLALLFVLLFRMERVQETFVWLAFYFGWGGLFSMKALWTSTGTATDLSLLGSLSYLGMSVSLAGYSTAAFKQKFGQGFWESKIVFLIGVGSLAIQVFLFKQNRPVAFAFERTLLFSSFGLFFWNAFLAFRHRERALFTKLDLASVAVIFLLHLSYVAERIVAVNQAAFFHLPLISASMTAWVIFFAIEAFVRNEKQLAFYGRFVRPGLKQLLQSQAKAKKNATDWRFRGREIPVLKIDIVGSTLLFSRMPYGVRRLYQHLWYTCVDQLTEGRTLYDRSEGDGSIYYFDDQNEEVNCDAVLKWALQIRDEVIPAFDELFRVELKKFLRTTPDLEVPMQRYIDTLQAEHGIDFWTKATQARFVLGYGMMDEGLWGLRSQSHYDLSGNLIVELTRLEKEAGAGQLLLTKDFWKKLTPESSANLESRFEMNRREKTFPGLGTVFFILIHSKKTDADLERSA